MLRSIYKYCFGLFATHAFLSACSSGLSIDKQDRFAVYYGSDATPEALKAFSVIVLDGDYHPDLIPLKDNHTLLGYVSLAEAKPHQIDSIDEALFIQDNPDWGGKLIDIRNEAWTEQLLEQQIPMILDKGFDGLMLDTIDSALHLETTDPDAYAGMREAAIALIKAIRQHFPNAKLMLNRGFAIHEHVASDIDMILAESILSHFDLKTDQASFFPDDVYASYVRRLHAINSQFKHLRVYSLDYWDITDKKGVKDIYAIQRSHGFIPYVTTPDLTTIHPEPSASFFWLSRVRDSKERV